MSTMSLMSGPDSFIFVWGLGLSDREEIAHGRVDPWPARVTKPAEAYRLWSCRDILGLKSDASAAEIERAFHEMARAVRSSKVLACGQF
jgi:hypothetical protein